MTNRGTNRGLSRGLSRGISREIHRGIEQILSRLPEMGQKVSRKLGEKIDPTLAADLKALAQNPRRWAALIESQSPNLGRRFLGVASNVVEPFLIGTGVSVEALGEDLAEVRLPGIWRNQSENGVIHSAAISAAAELASRLYWERHLDLRHSELRPVTVSTRLLGTTRESLRAVFRTTVSEREEVLHQLRANGETQSSGSVAVYDESGKLIAEVDIEWNMKKQLALASER